MTVSNSSELAGPSRSTSSPRPTNSEFCHEASQWKATTQGNLAPGLFLSTQFYFEENMVEILVEDTLFRIPRIFLTLQSEHFRAVFDKRDMNGNTDPLHLFGVTPTAFGSLLHVLYPLKFGKIEISSVDEWASVLDLSTKWGFADVRTLAIERLAAIASPVEKIALARTYGLDHWLKNAYNVICGRSEPLTLEEIQRLAPEDIAKICAAREAARGEPILHEVGPAVERVLCMSAEVPPHIVDLETQDSTPRSQEPTFSGGPPDSSPALPTMAVVEAVKDGLVLLSGQDPVIQQRGHTDVIDAVRRSDKCSNTLRSVLTLIINEGMKSTPEEGTRYATLCEALANTPGPADHSPPDTDVRPLSRRKLTRYIASICEGMVDYGNVLRATESDSAMRQAAFCANLFTKQLINIKFVLGWWNSVGLVSHFESMANIRSYCTFLSAVGHLIDLPDVRYKVNNTFLCFDTCTLHEGNSDWDKIRSEIQDLINLRAHGWSKV